MIGQLRGILIEKEPPVLMVDVHGVGYCVLAPLSTFFKLPELHQEVTLRTHMVVREDAQLLYGFATLEERALFEALIKVNGVGPKVALTILSGVSPDEFRHLMGIEDVRSLQRLPGIGAKTAQRILVEMRDKWGNPALATEQQRVGSLLPTSNDKTQTAIQALVSLGYKPHEAQKALSALSASELSLEEILKSALQGLAKL